MLNITENKTDVYSYSTPRIAIRQHNVFFRLWLWFMVFRFAFQWNVRRKTLNTPEGLSDHQLKDIGLSRDNVRRNYRYWSRPL